MGKNLIDVQTDTKGCRERARGREGESHRERTVTHLGHSDVMATRL